MTRSGRGNKMTVREVRFSRIQILLPVLIGLILTAIGVFIRVSHSPRAGMAASEASPVGSLRTINTGVLEYSATYDDGYPPSLQSLGPPSSGRTASCESADLIDQTLASGRKSGYVIEYIPGPTITKRKPGCPTGVKTYGIVARPVEFGVSGTRSFFTDESGIIRWTSEDRAAGPNDPLIN